MAGVGETLVREANRRGLFVFVDVDGLLYYNPAERMTEGFRRLLAKHAKYIKAWLITDAITIE